MSPATRFTVRCDLLWAVVLLASCVGTPTLLAQAPNLVETTLSGRLLLPEGIGTRGVEVIVSVKQTDGAVEDAWLVLDDEHRFRQSFDGQVVAVRINAGIARPVQRFVSADLQPTAGRIDLGQIDLRDRLREYSLVVIADDPSVSEVVRVGMWHGKPHPDVSLGSRQFLESRRGTRLDWLLPLRAESIYFLVEEPVDGGRGRQWRSGKHHLFGPFDTGKVSSELKIAR